MKKILAVMIGLCCLVAFSSISLAASEKSVKKDNKVVQEKQPSDKGQAVNRSGEENAKKKTVNKNIKRSSEHGTTRGTINGGGDFI
jgi:uncharacterized protein YxeA